MITTSSGTSYLTPVDREWLTDLRDSVRSLIHFQLSTCAYEHELVERAAAVTIWHGGRFQTVRELVNQCAAHNWNGTIYEAWVWETSNQVRNLLCDLYRRKDDSRRAVEVYAEHLGYLEPSYSEAMEAIEEAIRWRDGQS